MELNIKGKVLSSTDDVRRYSRDRSPYVIKPSIITVPKNEDDVINIVDYARKNSLPITARGAGSNLSGSALGTGIIIDFSEMNKIISIKSNRVHVQPGVIFEDINKKAGRFFLPYSPSSGSFCTIGGNVSTKAAGLRSVKYGSVDSFVRSVRFVDSRARIIDTSKKLPVDFKTKIVKLRKKILSDRKTMKFLRGREDLKTSSGYNIRAFYKYQKPEDIVTHLLVGSVGTLGLFTEIELELTKIPGKKITCLAYFKSLKDSGHAVMRIKTMKPSAIEIMDSFSLDILRKHKFNIPQKSQAALLIEFDSNLKGVEKKIEKILGKYAEEYDIESNPQKQKKLWSVRSSLLTIVENEKKNVIAFVEDVGVPARHLANFIMDLQNIFTKNRIEAVIFGHAGEGNLHLRPVIDNKDWKNKVKKIANACYSTAFKYGGTVTAEHGTGRNKAPYIRKEWGSAVYSYFKEIKKIFDPEGLLNPGIMFSEDDITKNMKY